MVSLSDEPAPVYLNTYRRPTPSVPDDVHLNTPPEAYDFNFPFEVKLLSSDRVQLRPFVPSLHAELLYDALVKWPELQRWLPLNVQCLADVLKVIDNMRSSPASLIYAIYTNVPGTDTPPTDPSEYTFAGTMGAINSSYDDMTSELGYIIILPPFQRTHVLSHAAGLLMHRILDPPTLGGWGLRRCQWYTISLNLASQKSSLRLGFTHEGVMRAARVLPKGKEGIRPGRKGDYKEDCMTRDTWVASVIWEEWEERVREHVDRLMARP